MLFTKKANDLFAPVDAAGNLRQIQPHDAQVWGTEVERTLTAVITSGGKLYASKAAMDADTAPAINTPAIVLGDATVANNGLYRKSAAAGTAGWTREGDVPGYSFITATNAGAGTANAIQATTSIPIPTADGGALIALPIVADNTASPVTVAFNGGTILTIKTNSGNDIAIGGLTAGMIVAGYVSGATFRLLSDQSGAAVLAGAEAARDAALAAVPNVFPADRTALAGIDTATHTVAYLTEAGREGTFLWRGSNLSTLVAADTSQVIYVAPASDPTGASGAWVRLHNTGEFLIEWAGGRRNDTTFDNKASHDAAVAALLATGFNVLRFGTGVYTYLSAPAPHTFGVKLVGAGYGSSLDNGATNLERRFNQTNTAHFLKWDGTGIAFNSTGGGIERLNVLAAPGSSGGTAVYLYATSDAQRPGYMEMSHLLVWGTSGGTWALAFVQDGSNCTTASGQGLRDVTFTDVFLSGATVEACQIINGTNNRYNGLYVYPAGGTTAKTRITGLSNAATSKSSNGFGTLFVSGELILDNCNEQILFGYASSIQITSNATNCKFYGDCPTVTFNGLTRYAAANSNNVQVVDKTTLQGTAAASTGTRLSPDGILEAWGTASLSNASAGVAMGVTFGVAPNVQMTVVNASAAYAFLTSVSTTTFNAAASVAGPVTAHWRAIGRAA